LSGIGGVARPGIVHVSTRETSGCLVVAKNDERILDLHSVATRKVEKDLLRDLCGRAAARLRRNPRGPCRGPPIRKRMAVDDEAGREAWDRLPRAGAACGVLR